MFNFKNLAEVAKKLRTRDRYKGVTQRFSIRIFCWLQIFLSKKIIACKHLYLIKKVVGASFYNTIASFSLFLLFNAGLLVCIELCP